MPPVIVKIVLYIDVCRDLVFGKNWESNVDFINYKNFISFHPNKFLYKSYIFKTLN